MTHTNIGLRDHARQYLGQPYWYGTCCYDCTESLLARKAKQYPSHYTEGRMTRYRDDIAKKKKSADCVGLIKGYYWTDENGVQRYVPSTDVSASGMYNKATVKGVVPKDHKIPEVPGLVLYAPGHVGVYEGDGYVIEAKGFAYGVIRTRIEAGKWTHWLACPFISYAGYENLLLPEPFTEPYTALVTTDKSPLNIWDSPAKGRSLLEVMKGDTLTVVDYGSQVGWYKAHKATDKGIVSGESDGQFLTKLDSPVLPEEETDGDDEAVDFAPYTARIVGVKESLNLRREPSMAAGITVLWIPLGALMEVLQEGEPFNLVRYAGNTGYATAAKMEKVV